MGISELLGGQNLRPSVYGITLPPNEEDRQELADAIEHVTGWRSGAVAQFYRHLVRLLRGERVEPSPCIAEFTDEELLHERVRTRQCIANCADGAVVGAGEFFEGIDFVLGCAARVRRQERRFLEREFGGQDA